MQDDKDLSSLKALAEAATPGPWRWDGPVWDYDREQDAPWLVAGTDDSVRVLTGTIKASSRANADFIAAANPAAILSLISRIEELEARIAECVGVLGAKDGELYSLRNQLAVAETKRPPAVDLSGLTRYGELLDLNEEICITELASGEYVKLSDVQALLASPANTLIGQASICVCGEPGTEGVTHRTDGPCYVAECSSPASDVGGLTKLTDEAIADLSAFTEGSIRDFPSFREELESLSTNQHKPTLKLIRKSIYDTIDARVRNAVKAAQAAREVLATKEAEPVQAGVRNAALEQAARMMENDFIGHPAWLKVRQVTAAIRALATSPAPAQAVQAPNEWMRTFDDLLDDYVGAAQETAVFNATQRSGMTVRLAKPRLKKLMAHVELLTSPAPSVKQEAMLVPKWAGEFSSFDDWVNRAKRVLSVPSHKPPAVCVDAKGRRCFIGADMARARDEGAFPVRYFWECELSAPTASQGEVKVPEGFKLVPIAPTPAMLLAGVKGFQKAGYNDCDKLHDWAGCYAAMIAAAPSVTDGEVK